MFYGIYSHIIIRYLISSIHPPLSTREDVIHLSMFLWKHLQQLTLYLHDTSEIQLHPSWILLKPNLPSLPVCRVVYPFFNTSTRLPVFFNFYPFWEFRFKKKKSKKKQQFVCLFLPVNIGEIRELINHFRSYRP